MHYDSGDVSKESALTRASSVRDAVQYLRARGDSGSTHGCNWSHSGLNQVRASNRDVTPLENHATICRI